MNQKKAKQLRRIARRASGMRPVTEPTGTDGRGCVRNTIRSTRGMNRMMKRLYRLGKISTDLSEQEAGFSQVREQNRK